MQKFVVPALVLFLGFVQPSMTIAQQRGTPQPQRGANRRPAAPTTPMTVRQVIEALSSLRSSSRVEEQISKAGVQFEATPAIVDILKQFGAGPKLISMIPVPPAPPAPPPVKLAGPLTVVCEPKDCIVAVDQNYAGATKENRSVVNGLRPGEVNIEVFAEGHEPLMRRVQIEADQPREEKFVLKRTRLVRQQSANTSLMKAVTTLGGVDGLAELGNIEGSGVMQWTSSSGDVNEWAMTFNKRIGRDLSATFKSPDGQCTASLLSGTNKFECRGGLRNGGDKIAEQGTTLFLSYQIQDVINSLLKRSLIASELDDNVLESPDTKDAYLLTLDGNGLPVQLVYRIGEDAPIHVRYSNYMNLEKGRYPGQISFGRLNAAPSWVFKVTSIRSRVVRGQ
jgi:hypothetical protein